MIPRALWPNNLTMPFGRLYVAAVQGLTQRAAEGAKALGGVKTVQDALAIQTSLGRGSFERAIAEGTKLPLRW
jgi:hypothetical protein